MSKNIIVTGIDGQAGQFMLKYLQQTQPQYNLIGTRRHKTNPTTTTIYDTSKVTYELMELTDSCSINNLVAKYEPAFFINFAANSFVGDSWAVPVQHLEQNTIGVLHQLEAIRKHSPDTRYFNSGSSEEFGNTIEGGSNLQNEHTKIDPKSPYGVSKAAAHYLVNVYRKSYNLFATQNYTYNFESELRGHQFVTRKVSMGVARAKRAILTNQPVEPIELGNLDSYRSWQFCGDVVDAVWKTLNNKEPKDYVVSSNQCNSIRELVETAYACIGVTGHWQDDTYFHNDIILAKTNPKFVRPSDVTLLKGDSSLIRQDLHWQSTLSFQLLIKRMVDNDTQII